MTDAEQQKDIPHPKVDPDKFRRDMDGIRLSYKLNGHELTDCFMDVLTAD